MQTPQSVHETAFEKARGVSAVDLQPGGAQVHIGHLPSPVMDHRLKVLAALKDNGINIKFLKLTLDGLSFLIEADSQAKVTELLKPWSPAISPDQCIVQVHAVNMRDEEGLIARIVGAAIESGAKLEHVGDMHDRLLIASTTADAERMAEGIRQQARDGHS